MDSTTTILAARKPTLYARFTRLLSRTTPTVVNLPTSPKDALEVGYRLGLQKGYGEGLVDGVALGVDVGAAMGPDFPEDSVISNS